MYTRLGYRVGTGARNGVPWVAYAEATDDNAPAAREGRIAPAVFAIVMGNRRIAPLRGDLAAPRPVAG